MSGVRCVPIMGYYESGIPKAAQCHSNCTSCTSLRYCTACISHYELTAGACLFACPVRQYVVGLSCLPCPFDCYTCLGNGSCLSCSAAVDHRYLSQGRCLPLPQHYETNSSTAAPCVSPCFNCSSASLCLSCIPLYELSGGSCVSYCPNATFPKATASSCQNLMPGFYLGTYFLTQPASSSSFPQVPASSPRK
jgi:hypothetical protein